MGWFGKKDNEEVHESANLLPQLPKLPELPKMKEEEEDSEEIHQLPSFPSSSLGEKFSRDTIKQAVSGNPKQETSFDKSWGREGQMVFEADDFNPKTERTMPINLSEKSSQKQRMPNQREPQLMPPRKREIKEIIPPLRKETRYMEQDQMPDRRKFELNEPEYEESEMTAHSFKAKRNEPVFIRLDKFETSLKTFEKAKKQLTEIEKMLKNIEDIKKEEEAQLESWKSEIMKIKEQIQKVDSDIFSSIE
jgi:hypothetical protein